METNVNCLAKLRYQLTFTLILLWSFIGNDITITILVLGLLTLNFGVSQSKCPWSKTQNNHLNWNKHCDMYELKLCPQVIGLLEHEFNDIFLQCHHLGKVSTVSKLLIICDRHQYSVNHTIRDRRPSPHRPDPTFEYVFIIHSCVRFYE